MEPKGKKMDVSNKKRFKEEFGEESDDTPPNLQRPDDYHAIFSGNVDDHFRIGTLKSLLPFLLEISNSCPLGIPWHSKKCLSVVRCVCYETQNVSLFSILLL